MISTLPYCLYNFIKNNTHHGGYIYLGQDKETGEPVNWSIPPMYNIDGDNRMWKRETYSIFREINDMNEIMEATDTK